MPRINIEVDATEFPIEEGTTFGQLKQNTHFKQVFGVSSNHEVQVNGTLEDDSYVLEAGDQISLHAKSCSKAAAKKTAKPKPAKGKVKTK